MVAWLLVAEAVLSVQGRVASHNSSGDVQRQFCADCGTGLFYRSASAFPGLVDVQSCTLDDPDAFAPTERIQLDDAPRWLARAADLPGHARFPRE